MPSLDWLGKEDIKHHHKNVEYKVIECKESIGNIDSENLIVKGDNLLALKSLLPYYANSVKMIYIDPPYNTGNTKWIYNDNVESKVIKKWLDKNVDREDLSRSDKWLCMMYPRLKLLRELLREDGVIFISIDDAEVGNLRLICDEIFGKENFIGEMVWNKKNVVQNDAKFISTNHEYILIYRKSNKIQNFYLLQRGKEQNERYKNPDNDPRGDWTSVALQAKSGSDINFEIEFSNGVKWKPTSGTFSRMSKKSLMKAYDDNRLWFGKDGLNVPRLKKFLSEVKDGIVSNSLLLNEKVGSTQLAKEQLKKILSKNIFDTPKPYKLISHLIQITCNKNDIILDSFAGSGTTAQAVLEQNREDGGNRKFILVEMEDYVKEITTERVKRVIEGYPFKGKDKTILFEKKLTTTQILKPQTMEKLSKEVDELMEKEKNNFDKIEKTFKDNTLIITGIKEIDEFKEGIGGGFKYCELGESLFDEDGRLNSNIPFEEPFSSLSILHCIFVPSLNAAQS